MKIASEKERKAAIDKAQSELDFWKGVADELAKRNGTTAENVAPQADEAEETLTADEAATDIIILEVEPVDEENENYLSVQDEAILDAVYGLFKEKYKDVLTFEEE